MYLRIVNIKVKEDVQREDFERLFIHYMGEAYPRGKSIQYFCHRPVRETVQDTGPKVVKVKVSGCSSPQETEKAKETFP